MSPARRVAAGTMDHELPRSSWTSLLRRIGLVLVRLPLPVLVLLPLSWMGLVWFLSSQRIDTPGGAFGLWGFLGNLAHAPLFGFLALFWTALFLRCPGGDWPALEPRTRLLVLALVVGYGVIDELHQRSVGGRQASGLDVVTDFVGAVCVLWIVGYLGARDSREGGLRLRLAASIVLCALAAWLGLS